MNHLSRGSVQEPVFGGALGPLFERVVSNQTNVIPPRHKFRGSPE